MSGEIKMDKKENQDIEPFGIPPVLQYEAVLSTLQKWLQTIGKDKLFSLAQHSTLTLEFDKIESTHNAHEFSVYPTDSGSTTISIKTNIDNTITEIESIVKLLNKHKALLEASKGIE